MLSRSNIYFISITSVCHYIINQKESLKKKKENEVREKNFSIGVINLMLFGGGGKLTS